LLGGRIMEDNIAPIVNYMMNRTEDGFYHILSVDENGGMKTVCSVQSKTTAEQLLKEFKENL
jgi:hypothetical protein